MTESLFKDLKILAFKKLVIQRILLMMFKHNIGIVPKPISSLFTKKSEIHNYNTRHSSSLHPAIGKSEATYRTYIYLSCNFNLELSIKINMYECHISLL